MPPYRKLPGSGGGGITAHHHLHRAQQVARLEADQLLDLERSPRGDHLLGLRARVLLGGGHERGVDRAHAGAGDDVDRRVPAHALREVRAQVVNDSSLVGAARPAAREHDADLRSGLARCLHYRSL
jgi:hypothetical protein